MARQAAHLVLSERRPAPRQAIWDAIRNLRRFTRDDLARTAAIEIETVRSYVSALEKGGVLRRAGKAAKPARALTFTPARCRERIVYELVRDSGAEAPRLDRDGQPVKQGLARDHLWRAMKMLSAGGDFDYRELAVHARTDDVRVGETDAQHYVKHLLKARYLAVVAAARKRALARYRLVLNTGPLAPMVQRLRTVFDPNLRKIVWHEEADR